MQRVSGWICSVVAILLAAEINSRAGTFFVYVNGTNATPPFNSWATAATNIQDAINAASDGDLVLVTNGLYATGGTVVFGAMTNRVAVTKPLTVQSVNGPGVTIIQGQFGTNTIPFAGDSAVRCVYLTNGASLIGFTLTNGATRGPSGDALYEQAGGGAWCESTNAYISNCVIIRNGARTGGGGVYRGSLTQCSLITNTATWGGGAAACFITNCNIISNRATFQGGGGISNTIFNSVIGGNTATPVAGPANAGGMWGGLLVNCVISNNFGSQSGGVESATLYNCLVISNRAGGTGVGGVFNCTLNNCTVVGNIATNTGGVGGVRGGTANGSIIFYNAGGITGGDNYHPASVIFSKTFTTPAPGGGGVFTNDPAFVDLANGNARLSSDSPCINSGSPIFPTLVNPDLAGNPRVSGGTVDIGAYEFQSPPTIISIQWLQRFGFATDGSADFQDPDGDGGSNWQEWQAATNPTNAASVLRVVSISAANPGLKVSYTNGQPEFNRFYYLQRSTNLNDNPSFSNIMANSGPGTTFTDTNAVGPGPYFYRVGVSQ